MNAMKEGIKRDLHKDPDELEHEADRARADVEHTLEALERRFSPGEMLDQVLQVIKRNGGDFGSNLAAQVRSNPLPTILAGAGITWLIASSVSGRAHAGRHTDTDSGDWLGMGEVPGESMSHRTGATIGDRMSASAETGTSSRSGGNGGSSMASSVKEKISSAGEAMGERMSSAGETARSAAESAKGAVHGAAHRMRNTGEGLAEASRSGMQGIRQQYEYLSREQPLVLGALAVAVGAAIGALLPSSEAENRLMGEASEDATTRIKEEGRRQAEKARSVATEMSESVAEHTRSRATSGSTAGTPATRS